MRSRINRKESFFLKFYSFCQLAINGGYKIALVLKSYLRDLSGLSEINFETIPLKIAFRSSVFIMQTDMVDSGILQN